ncbi:hypothetical protein [Nonomuraea angiospora]
MADLVCLRHSTDKRTDARQRHALTALLAAGAPVYEDPATSSRQRMPVAAQRDAACGDTSAAAAGVRVWTTQQVGMYGAASGRNRSTEVASAAVDQLRPKLRCAGRRESVIHRP